MTTTRPMSAADAAWWRMDRPTNHMVINAVMTLDRPLDLAAIRALLRDRLVARFPPFRQVVVDGGPLNGLHWSDPDHFDLDLHLHRRALSPPGDRHALQTLVGDLMATGMDPAKPLWDAYLVDGYGSGSALIVRMHHCIADGIALSRVLLTLTDDAVGTACDQTASPSATARHSPLGSVTAPLRMAAHLGHDAVAALVHESTETLVHPDHLLDLGREVRDDASALVDLLAAPRDPETVLRGPHGIAQRVAWTAPLSLPEVKAVAHTMRVTVNDVLLAALAGALTGHLAAHDQYVDDLHVMVPFNIRPPHEPLAPDLGNRFGLILLALPVGPAPPLERLREVHRRMGAIKDSRQAVVSFATLTALGHAPAQVEGRFIDFMSAKSTAVVTNVPGPRARVSLTGVRVREVHVWAPCAGSVGMSVSLFSYCDTISVGFMTHAEIVPDPEGLAERLSAELAAIRAAAGEASSR